MKTIAQVLTQAKAQSLLMNTNLENAIAVNIDGEKQVSPSLELVILQTFGEANRRELGVYTTAAILVALINSAR